MLPTYDIMTNIARIGKIVLPMIGGIAVLAAVLWLIVLLIELIVEALRLIASGWQQASALVASMPALHFLLLLALSCFVIWASVWLIRRTAVLMGVRYVR